VVDNLLAAPDQQVSNAAHDAAPMLEEADDESFGRVNVTGNVSATRASSAVCSSAIRLSIKSRSKSHNSVRGYGYGPSFVRTSSSLVTVVRSTLQAAARRSVGRSRMGLPPGGGPPSSALSASRISSIVTGAFSPSGARSDGQDAIADASEAYEARMARFSASVRPE
jgi:hypothetical protein